MFLSVFIKLCFNGERRDALSKLQTLSLNRTNVVAQRSEKHIYHGYCSNAIAVDDHTNYSEYGCECMSHISTALKNCTSLEKFCFDLTYIKDFGSNDNIKALLDSLCSLPKLTQFILHNGDGDWYTVSSKKEFLDLMRARAQNVFDVKTVPVATSSCNVSPKTSDDGSNVFVVNSTPYLSSSISSSGLGTSTSISTSSSSSLSQSSLFGASALRASSDNVSDNISDQPTGGYNFDDNNEQAIQYPTPVPSWNGK
jgi:hypothetical protein